MDIKSRISGYLKYLKGCSRVDFKNLVFISGKGGTGKTTLSLIIAKYLTIKAKKVLLVELGGKSSASSLLNLSLEPKSHPSPSSFGFDWCRLEGIDCLTEYVASFAKLEKITQSFFENSIIQSLVNLAPGLNDLAVLGKLTSHLRNHGPGFNYDHIIVDGPSTGSFYSFLEAPKLLGESVKGGPMHTQCESIAKCLEDLQKVQYVFASLYEPLPVDELIETYNEFSSSYKNQLTIIMNKSLSIEKLQGTDNYWSEFINEKNRVEEIQEKRVIKLDCPKYNLPLFTNAFNDYLNKLKGEPFTLLSKN
jgi:anion-transporting  ArsA/GET3 family ATPase